MLIRRAQTERWLPVAGYEDYYEVSSLGRARALTYWGRALARPRLMRGEIDRCGYIRICLTKNRKEQKRFLHSLVMEAFVGPCPPGLETCHDDGDSLNCRLSNLVYGTHSRNMQDRVRHGTSSRGEANGNVALTAASVLEIREALSRGVTGETLSEKYRVGRGTISRIKLRQTWWYI